MILLSEEDIDAPATQALLSPAEIAAMGALCGETFDSTAVIQGGTIVSDSGGGGTESWATRGTVSCHVSPILVRGDREGVTAGRISQDSDWIVTFPAGTDVTQRDRIVIDATTYEVEAVRAPRTWELTRRVEVSRVV